jgi:hypothetical protein
MKMAVTIDGATTELEIKPFDLVAFERKYDIQWGEVQGSPKIEHIFFLGWSAAHRTGATTDDFDAWLAQVDSADPVDEPKARPLDHKRRNSSPSQSASGRSRTRT